MVRLICTESIRTSSKKSMVRYPLVGDPVVVFKSFYEGVA